MQIPLTTLGISLLALVFGCEFGDNSVTLPKTEEALLKHDRGNVSAPLLPAGLWEAAVRLPATMTLDVKDGKVAEIHYYIERLPEICRLKIYGRGTRNQPGALLYVADVLSEITAPRWNKHIVTSNLAVSGEDLWLGIEFKQSNESRTMGADAGPVTIDGEWLFSDSDNRWQTLEARRNIQANWNLRALIRTTLP